MKIIKYIFFSLIMFFDSDIVYAGNSYNVLSKNDINQIQKVLDNNNNVIVNLNYNDEKIIKRKVLDLIKNKDKTITYNILDDNEVIYSYKFNGKYFNKSYNDINLNINYYSDNDDFINKVFNSNKKIIINTEYKGNYPSGTILSIKDTKNMRKVFLYAYNKDIYKIKNITKNSNFIDINISKGDTYILSSKELVNTEIVKVYISILIILFIEIFIFVLIVFFRKKIEIPKLKAR